MEKYDRTSGVFWLLFGIFILIGAQSYAFGSFREPGGGLYPTLLGGLLIILGCILLFNSSKKSMEEAPSWAWKGGGLRRSLLTLCGLLVIPFLFNTLGFHPTIFLFILFITRAVLPLPWLTAFTTSLCSTVGGYFLFESWLKIQFPRGLFGF